MIVQLIFKILLAYFFYVIGKGLWNAYKTVKLLKNAQGPQQRANPFGNRPGESQKPHEKSSSQGGDVFEAEYRVLNSKKE